MEMTTQHEISNVTTAFLAAGRVPQRGSPGLYSPASKVASAGRGAISEASLAKSSFWNSSAIGTISQGQGLFVPGFRTDND